jgi:ABC-2 type transport system ATP-binding protein
VRARARRVYCSLVIKVEGLTKRYGDTTAVDEVSFTVRPGVVTGFLGPNGAGKSTTMRLILGLDRPTSGSVMVNGKQYRHAPAPMHEVGALLEAKAVHTSRSAYNHLRVLAATHRIPARRVDEVLDLVGLSDVARKRVGGFSLGMGQRLGIASALLGDPDVVILDEPINGLDPEGIRWVRDLLGSLADEGRTVFVSSHLMSEMALTAQHVVIVGRGRVIADVAMDDIIAGASPGVVIVRTPDVERLAVALRGPGITTTSAGPGSLEVSGTSAEAIGEIAFDQRILLHALIPQEASLEEVFMEMTRDAVEYHGHVETAA